MGGFCDGQGDLPGESAVRQFTQGDVLHARHVLEPPEVCQHFFGLVDGKKNSYIVQRSVGLVIHDSHFVYPFLSSKGFIVKSTLEVPLPPKNQV